MAKQKNPTPQELYRARKEREEQERNALLPPGLINHGNTCFMNSVLQGLIATPLLYDLVYPAHSTSRPRQWDTSSISLYRSPQLTNGHNLGGPHEKEWVEGMPLGDVFFNLMLKAWSAQGSHQRTNLSAKEVLSAIGKKYDQYLDFAQQDAHEFLRQLLDSMRMEEMDIIKKRQPPPVHERKKHRRRATITLPSAPDPQEEKLASVADMIFGGKLTSILVCQACKHVSHNYEDFNDLSLSIKPEDYVRERKRDRLKNLAKKLANFNASSPVVAPHHGPPNGAAPEMQRSSSVPSSPRRPVVPLPPADEGRASVDVVTGGPVVELKAEAPPVSSAPAVIFQQDRQERKIKKAKHPDPWVKISRRISLTVGLGKSTKDKHKRKSQAHSPTEDLVFETASSARTSISDVDVVEARVGRPSLSPEPRTSPKGSVTVAPLPALSSPNGNANPRMSTSRGPSPSPQRLSKSFRPFKPSPPEIQYLRQILADVHLPSSNPFALFNPHVNGASGPTTAQNMWMKMNHLTSVEECLRLFTAVEVLDGENMVGCRRCWKMQNGMQVSPAPAMDAEEESESEEDVELPLPPVLAADSYIPNGALTPVPQEAIPTSLSSPSLGLYPHQDASANASTSSLPSSLTTSSQLSTMNYKRGSGPPPLPRSPGFYAASTPGGLPIPLIATIAPDSPVRSPTTARAEAFSALEGKPNGSATTSSTASSLSFHRTSDRDSLHAPSHFSRRQTADIGSTTDDDSGGEESDASTTSALSSANTSTPSLLSNPQDSPPTIHTTPTLDASNTPKVKDSGIPPRPTESSSNHRKKLPKPVILRPAYKRYLIATPPPILVIHLKRFQQLTKTPIMSFSHGFKKLDDYVAFPEHLDLTPFLAPRKEDFGLGKKGHGDADSVKAKDKPKCMYRLYAVVVHIGNMLGGHYVAYTALPTLVPPNDATTSASSTAEKSSSSHPHPHPHSTPRQWAYISDTVVRLTTLEDVLKAKAYLCMYERI
ncbi:hypothetical protein PLEOSDRAFT_1114588 [Pleurotus ostreatus PC15]|uniref:Ubiquitin carboxyl-terminal hydrolase n=1 Tax=Pleurotus ostreatus (strain PC15) TaxID=1137138 RepID=A0A067N350_PLEO1|nr:hypothetical protein PLEOSDRAFT_1114588 [Pleurotus ostreatus PC15]